MRYLFLFVVVLVLVGCPLAQNGVGDVVVPAHTVEVAESIRRPKVKYAPAYNIQIGDTVAVVFYLNGNEAKRYTYINSEAPLDTNHVVRLVGRLQITEVNK